MLSAKWRPFCLSLNVLMGFISVVMLIKLYSVFDAIDGSFKVCFKSTKLIIHPRPLYQSNFWKVCSLLSYDQKFVYDSHNPHVLLSLQ